MSGAPPRRIAIAIVRDETGRLLVTSAVDPVTGRTFARPPGGGIEPGETPEAAIVRELEEELGFEATAPRLLGTLDNRFVFAGMQGHETVAVLAVTLPEHATVPPTTDAGHPVWWLGPEAGSEVDLVPAGLEALLTAQGC